jgi:hypothetical protein
MEPLWGVWRSYLSRRGWFIAALVIRADEKSIEEWLEER